MDRFRGEHSRGSRDLRLKAVLVVVEVERDHLEDLDQDIVHEGLAAIVVVDRSDQTKGMTNHDKVLRTIMTKYFGTLRILKTNDTELPVIRPNRELAVSFSFHLKPSQLGDDRLLECGARAELRR